MRIRSSVSGSDLVPVRSLLIWNNLKRVSFLFEQSQVEEEEATRAVW